MKNESEYLTYDEAAKLIGVPKGTLYSLVTRKQVPHHRHGPRLVRFSRKEILKWIKRNRIGTNK